MERPPKLKTRIDSDQVVIKAITPKKSKSNSRNDGRSKQHLAPKISNAAETSRARSADRTSLSVACYPAPLPQWGGWGRPGSKLDQLGITLDECAYCGARASDLDHPSSHLSKNKRPSGYFHGFKTLVPSCGGCNQSKGEHHWEKMDVWTRKEFTAGPQDPRLRTAHRAIA